MATIHISEAEAARDFAGLMAKVRAGAEIVIEHGTNPLAVLHSAVPSPRTISESIEIARKLQQETGEAPILEADFAGDAAEILGPKGGTSGTQLSSRQVLPISCRKEDGWRDVESLAERFDVRRVQLAFPGENLGDDALSAQIGG